MAFIMSLPIALYLVFSGGVLCNVIAPRSGALALSEVSLLNRGMIQTDAGFIHEMQQAR